MSVHLCPTCYAPPRVCSCRFGRAHPRTLADIHAEEASALRAAVASASAFRREESGECAADLAAGPPRAVVQLTPELRARLVLAWRESGDASRAGRREEAA